MAMIASGTQPASVYTQYVQIEASGWIGYPPEPASDFDVENLQWAIHYEDWQMQDFLTFHFEVSVDKPLCCYHTNLQTIV